MKPHYDVSYWVERLKLEPHPEGGYFREVYRSGETIPVEALPERYNGPRAFATTIFFLLDRQDFSAFHRLNSDEQWQIIDGSPLLIHIIDGSGKLSTEKLGWDLDAGEQPVISVPKGVWFAAEPEEKTSYCLASCIVAPGFEFADFELASRDQLYAEYPFDVVQRLSLP